MRRRDIIFAKIFELMIMTLGKIFRRTLTALLIVAGLLTAAVVDAAVKLYTATGEDYPSEVESQDIAKQRALDKAIKKAVKEAGVYLKTYSRTLNSELTDDEITAITSNAWQLVGEPIYNRTFKQISDETTIIIWTAKVEVNIDDAVIQSWLNRDEIDKSTIISQTRAAQLVSDENERTIVNLREQYNRATSQAEKERICKLLNDTDRDFLANQKLEEGLRHYYADDYAGAIKLYNEAIELKPNYTEAYVRIGHVYFFLKNLEQAFLYANKAIDIEPTNSECYIFRAALYREIDDWENYVADVLKAKELGFKF